MTMMLRWMLWKVFIIYVHTPASTQLKFKCITETETLKAIDNLENKNSSGHDGISNKLLKLTKNIILFLY